MHASVCLHRDVCDISLSFYSLVVHYCKRCFAGRPGGVGVGVGVGGGGGRTWLYFGKLAVVDPVYFI